MNDKTMKMLAFSCMVVGLLAGSIAIADPANDSKSADQPEFPLPAGWTQADMQACIAADTPGKMHQRLVDGAGVWHGKTITWKHTYNCPLTEKRAVLREVETITGPDTKTLEMFGADPKSGKEYQMMRIEFTKK